MLPSWIRSRNCRPRLVYFLAMEMTRRRFASTISFLARRALASPRDMARLISLTWATVSPVSSTTARRRRCARRSSSAWAVKREDQSCLPVICFSSHFSSISLPGNSARNTFFGMRPRRMSVWLIIFSCSRTASRLMRTRRTISSKCFGVSLSGAKHSESALRSLTAAFPSRP